MASAVPAVRRRRRRRRRRRLGAGLTTRGATELENSACATSHEERHWGVKYAREIAAHGDIVQSPRGLN